MDTIGDVVQRVRSATYKVALGAVVQMGDGCSTCHGFGWLRGDKDIGDPDFGRLTPCPECRAPLIKESEKSSIYQMSMYDMKGMSFDNFMTSKTGYTRDECASLERAKAIAQDYANHLSGWLILAGDYGCGKTHLAASVANQVKIPSLFITLPDLLDQLRDGFADSTYDYYDRFESIRNIDLLVLDDLGAEKATPWAAEKIFQLINTRYVRAAPTVFTTNVSPSNIDGRILSRMMDERLSIKVSIDAPDYRRKVKG